MNNISPEDLDALGRMSLSADDLFGPCDDVLEIRLPSELKDLLRREASKRRMTLAAYVRISLATAALGPDHVAMLLLQRVGVAQQQAQVDVPTHGHGRLGAGALSSEACGRTTAASECTREHREHRMAAARCHPPVGAQAPEINE